MDKRLRTYCQHLERSGFDVSETGFTGTTHFRIVVRKDGKEHILSASASPKDVDTAARMVVRDARRLFRGTYE